MGRKKDKFKQIEAILPEGWAEQAKELGAFKRAGEIKTPGELLRLILLYLTEGRSFAGTSALVQMAGGIKISKVAIFKRMRNSASWLEWLCENIYR